MENKVVVPFLPTKANFPERSGTPGAARARADLAKEFAHSETASKKIDLDARIESIRNTMATQERLLRDGHDNSEEAGNVIPAA